MDSGEPVSFAAGTGATCVDVETMFSRRACPCPDPVREGQPENGPYPVRRRRRLRALLHRGLRDVRAARDGGLEQGRVRVTAVLPRHCMTVDTEA